MAQATATSGKARIGRTATPSPAAARAEEKRRDIILAAAAEFSNKGYAEATLADIAARLGIHTAGLYYYFENKDAIVEALLQFASERMALQAQEILKDLPDATPLDRMKTLVRSYVTASGERDDVARAFYKIYDQVSPELRRRYLKGPKSFFSLWRKTVAAAVEAGQIRTDVSPSLQRMLLAGSMFWIAEWYRPNGRNSLEEISDALIAIYFGPAETRPAEAAPRPAAARPSRKAARAAG